MEEGNIMKSTCPFQLQIIFIRLKLLAAQSGFPSADLSCIPNDTTQNVKKTHKKTLSHICVLLGAL